MDRIILYSTDCPKCKILKKKLDSAGINYEVEKDMTEVMSMGYTSAPLLKVNDNILEFSDAIKYISR